ncbi:uncharacterized protein E5676_scaffold186G00680 [Cucumis melo var. makuwa]|uniref:Uncharacterized protein n=1 Tax=Cucumis melo var. makuwa TaxID=1194695 RepID=A0A5A7SN26_CUCMM|nr:uncharacterized protein E6C27_scaffold452G00930 [Cucumis melo var. makuwa]TYK14415.1 uncharacterized protein E5676_scaffold186G00680 [Cucumis melo var. makuwa]
MSIQSPTVRWGNTCNASSLISELFSSGNKIFIVKLNDDNFLLWKFQVVTALED